MTTMGTVVSLSILAAVFAPALIMFTIIVGSVLYGSMREAGDGVLGWRTLTCPKTRTLERIRVRRVRVADTRQLAVVNCSRFADRQPRCRQVCLSILPQAAGA